MISFWQDGLETVLFYPGQSLLEQVTEWMRRHRDVSLRLVTSRGIDAVREPVKGASMVVIDATEHPDMAGGALPRVLKMVPIRQAAVYTERTNHGLEIFVRMRGVMFLLGPMTRLEWEAFFQPMTDAAAQPQEAGRGRRRMRKVKAIELPPPGPPGATETRLEA
jgi:hypothetical protein